MSMNEVDSHRLRVAEIVRETDDACSVVFEPPAGVDFTYSPGQFLTLRLPLDSGPIGRCYSLCSSPHRDEPMRIAVKRVNDGLGSNWINDTLAVGDELECLVPSGMFTPKSLDDDLLLFAGGSGITPVLSILKSALHAGNGNVVLVYANQHENAVIFSAQLRELAEQYPDRLHVLHWLESVQGIPSRAQLKALAAPFTEHTAFVCGPSPFMESVSHSLRELGVPPARIHIERFQSLTEDPFTLPAADASAVVDEAENGPATALTRRPRRRDARIRLATTQEAARLPAREGPQGAVLVPAGRVQRVRLHPGRRRGQDAAQRDPRAGRPRRGLRARLPVATDQRPGLRPLQLTSSPSYSPV